MKQADGGWIRVERNTSLRADWREEWMRFKGLFKLGKSKAGHGEGEWRRLMDLHLDMDEVGPKLKSKKKSGAQLRRVKARNDVSTNF